jgi:hypothetical protein
VARSPKSPEQRERLAAALRENLKRRKARDRTLAENERLQNSESEPERSKPERPV